MDIEQLLEFNPEIRGKQPKRSADNDEKRSTVKKRKGIEAAAAIQGNEENNSSMSEAEKDRLEKLLEAAESVETLDESKLKKLILSFEKKVFKNQELRIKFPDAPEKFLESEVELNDVIQEMHVVATTPDLYRIVVELNCVNTMLGLLSHDNTDISCAVVDLLQEMTDVDTLNENDDGADLLIDAVFEQQIVALLVQNMERMDETLKEEANGVHSSLGIVENLLEFRPEMASAIAKQGLMQWLLKRMKAKMPFDANKLYASEIVAILVQNDDDNRELVGHLNGIDILLQQLSYFKRHNPTGQEDIEYMENLFDCMCSCLMWTPNRERFLVGEGLQLMNLMLREKKLSRVSALKVLDYALMGDEGVANCNKFVDILGLRTVFPLFMKTPQASKKTSSEEEHEEHVCSAVASLLRNCQGTQRHRLLAKFTENDLAKVDRLLELHFKYLTRVNQCDVQIEKDKAKMKADGGDITDDVEDGFYLRRLDAGLFTLQLVDRIILEVCLSSSGVHSIKERVLRILNLRGGSVKTIKSIMREYAGNVGDESNPAGKEAEQQRILQLVDKF